MKKHSFSDPIDPAVMRCIESTARRFSRLHRLPSASAEDLVQILAIKYLHVRASGDQSKLTNWAYLKRVLLNECRSFLRQLKAKKRWPRTRLDSLNTSMSDATGRAVDASQTTPDPRSADEPRRRDLRRKLRDIGKRRPAIERLREWVERTGRKPMPSQLESTAKASGFRSADELRQFFEDEGLLDLL